MGGFSSSRSSSRSRSSSTQRTFIDPRQQQFLSSLLDSTQGVLDQTLPGIGGVATGLADRLTSSGNVLLDAVTGLATGGGPDTSSLRGIESSPLASALLRTGGGDGRALALDIARSGGGAGTLPGASIFEDVNRGTDALLRQGPGVNASIDQLSEAIARNSERQAGALGIEASLAGAGGGSREALALGLIGEEANRSFAQGATNILNTDLSERRALAPQLLNARLASGEALQRGGIAERDAAIAEQGLRLNAANLVDTGERFDRSLISDLLNLDIAGETAATQAELSANQLRSLAAESGIGSLQGLFNLGLAPSSAVFSPLLSAAQILGDPSILSFGESQSRGRTRGSSSGFSILGSD